MLTITEWQTGEIPSHTLSPHDRKLADQLAGRLTIDELRSGVRVRATSWVGVVQFEHFTVQVIPKLAGEHVGLAHLLTWTSGLDALRRNQGDRTLALVPDAHLFDLVALLFAQACDRIVRAGLLHDYVEQEADLPVMRGRLLVSRQVRQRFGRVDRLECRFDDHLSDILENQLIAAVLGLCRLRMHHPQTRLHIHRLYSLFASVCTSNDLDLLHCFDNLTYHRLNDHYREAHTLARLIVDGLQVEDPLVLGQTRCFAFLLDMNHLFERFVTKLAALALPGADYRLHPQHRDHTVIWNVTHGRPYMHIRPDLLIETATGQRLAIDAKYKLYDERTIDPGDLYQGFLYAHANHRSEESAAHTLLCYPASHQASPLLHLRIQGRHAEVATHIHAVGLPIPALLHEVQTTRKGPLLAGFSNLIQSCLASTTRPQPHDDVSSRVVQPGIP
jgi:5-methylcytosine-specific restriction enzyme subunit McrC